jgi:hypothetical protein
MSTKLIIGIVLTVLILTLFFAGAKFMTGAVEPPLVITPTPTAPAPTYRYVGCYKDTEARDLPTRLANGIDLGACYNKAKTAGMKYFGLQYYDKSRASECWGGNSFGKFGQSTNACLKDTAGNSVGGGWQNAVYEVL